MFKKIILLMFLNGLFFSPKNSFTQEEQSFTFCKDLIGFAAGVVVTSGALYYWQSGKIPEKHTWSYPWDGQGYTQIVNNLKKDKVFAAMPLSARANIIHRIQNPEREMPEQLEYLLNTLFDGDTDIVSGASNYEVGKEVPRCLRFLFPPYRYTITRAGIAKTLTVEITKSQRN